MTPRILRAALAAAFLFAAAAALLAVRENERVLADGQVVLARLAPVDPRSLMQGDYMALRYAIDDELPHRVAGGSVPPAYVWLRLDEAGRTEFAGLADTLPPPGLGAMKVRRRDGRYSIGPNAFFFQEGTAEAFAEAKWGEFRVDAQGKALLTHLRDDALQRLGENRR